MNIAGYGNRYLSHKEFLRLCKDLEINSFTSNMDERWLELLEEEKILFPVCRIIFPLSYLKIINDVRYNPSNPYYSNKTFYLPNRYGNIERLKSNIHHFWLNKNLSHVLDKLNTKFSKYVQYPKQTKFQKWKRYKKMVGKFQEIEHYESVAEHYYSYWQAYHFYEITQACTLNYVINVFDEEIRSKLWQLKIPIKKIFSGSLPLRYDNIKGDFWDQGKNFEALSFYVQTIKKYDFLVSHSKVYKKDRFGYLDEESVLKYNKTRIKLTKLIVKKYRLKLKEIYDFLRFLCRKFDEYKENKKDKLVQFIKQDISCLIQLMQDGFDLEFEKINQKVGRVISDFGNTLDVIFPPIFAKERKNVLDTLNSFLSNELNFYRYENVAKEEVKAFLNYLDSNNLQLFYHSLGQINFNHLRDQSNYLHIFYLSLLLENIIKVIGRKSKKKDLVEYLSSYREMQKILDKFFNSEGWRHTLSNFWSTHTTINPSTDIKEKILNDISKVNFHEKDKWNQIIKMFLVCGIARNLSAHEHSKVYHIDRETHLILVNNIVSAIWFTWKYAIEKGYISISKYK